ncbi:uncharacterized protein LOC112184181 [Rosa chinensis]|uniref:uncharacterized protein LOC112184181 n=1 Tax=Rosa chinensis TaxID=74649 RepID=UPI000D093A15|nr:uncharacterized protein LOC112184181 [Rosa chinensis]
MLLMLISGLWKNRNSQLWENKASSASDIFQRCITWLEEFHQASKPVAAAAQLPVSKKWSPESTVELTLNVDGAFLPQLPKGGLGKVLRNTSGEVQAAFQTAVQFVSSPMHAELLAIQSGLQLVRVLQFESVCIVSDCLLAVQDINNGSPILTEYGPLIEDIGFILQQLHPIKITYAPRACNKLAHRLASLAYESEQSVSWLHTIPDCIQDIVQQEIPPLI